MSHKLTKYPIGSVHELWHISFPMILTFLSGNLMMFFDRLFLANYSTAAMNAAAAAGLIAAVCQFGFAIITSIAEVFVGQFNGQKLYEKTSSPTWQMLWFSAMTPIIFFSLALIAAPYLLPEYHYYEFGLPYFRWILFFAAVTPAISAVAAFFVGIGKTRLILTVTIVGNLINLILDPILIFGIKDVIPSYGTKGAAIATGVSQLIQFIALMFVFLNARHRKKYGTGLFRFDFLLFVRCLKVGVPNSIGHMIEWMAWAISIRLMSEVSEHHLTVATIGQSIYMLGAFGFEGLQKGVTTIVANSIGAGLSSNIWKVWRSAVKLLVLFSIPFGIFLLGYPDPLIYEFLSKESPPEDIIVLSSMLRTTCIGIWVYYLVDGFTWICVGVLTAAEDTYFTMWVNALTAWLCGLLPIIILMVYMKQPPTLYWGIICFYGLCNSIVFYNRLRKEPWRALIAR